MSRLANTIDAEPASPTMVNDETRLLLVYAIYRSVLTLIVWALFLAGSDIGQHSPPLFLVTMIGYSAINLVLLYRSAYRWQPHFWLLLAIIASDIFAIHLTALSSGSFGNGMEVLMFASVAAGSLFLKSSQVLVVPAIATLTLLFSGLIQFYFGEHDRLDLVASGWLGSLFFIASLFVSYLKQRIETSEQSARREKANVEHFQNLNSVIIERMQTGIIIVDQNAGIVSSNEAAMSLMSADNSNGANINGSQLEQLHPKIHEFYLKAQTLRTEKPQASTTLEQPRFKLFLNGKSLQFTLVFLNEDRRFETIIFIEDLSKITQHAQQLKLSSLGKLTASIAHEIRNPLGAISHAAQLLGEDEPSKENARLTEIIVNQSKRCSAVIESILDISRGGQSHIEIFTLNTWLDTFLNDFNIIEQGDIKIVGDNNLSVRFDKAQLGQVLSNLLTNAFRFSEETSGKKSACLLLQLDDQDRPRIDICDYGQGVTDELQDKIFEPFFTTSNQGSGLGLYLSRELCEANQATLTYVTAPYKTTNYKAANHKADANEPGKRCELSNSFSHCFRLQFSHHAREPFSL